MRINSTKKILLYCTIIALIVVITVLSHMVFFSYQISDDRILPGVYINGSYVGGMTQEQVKEAITNDLSAYLLDNSTAIVNGETQLIVDAADISDLDVGAIARQACNTNRENTPITYLDFIKMKFTPVNIETTAVLDWQKIYDLIELNQHMFYKGSTNAQLMDYSFEGEQLHLNIIPSQTGYKINARETATAVQNALASGTAETYAVMDTLNPDITTNALMQMANDPAVYAQVFPVVTGNVSYDIYEDLDQINTLVKPILIMPGQSVSTKEFIQYDDYTLNLAAFKRLHMPSIIYGCALQVGLDIAEHHPSDYITDDMQIYPYGQEAILDKDKDLILTNNFAYPIIINLLYDNANSSHKLICKIYHVESLEYTYIKSVIERHDDMYHVAVYRVYANDTGGVLSRTLLEEHIYPVPFEIIHKEQEIIEQTD